MSGSISSSVGAPAYEPAVDPRQPDQGAPPAAQRDAAEVDRTRPAPEADGRSQPNILAWNQAVADAKADAGHDGPAGFHPVILEAAPIALPPINKPDPKPDAPPPTLGPASSTDDAAGVLDNSSYSSGDALKKWDGVTAARPGPDREALEKELNRPIAAAQALSDNWDKWGMHNGVSFANPPADLPPEAQAIIKYVGQNPALAAALDTADSGGKAIDNRIEKHDVDQFIKTASKQAEDASGTMNDWLKNNADAGDQSKALAQSAAIVMANQSLAHGADPDFQAGKNGDDGYVTPAGLAQLGQQNPGLGTSLGDAARLWGNSGMFKVIDNAGDDISTKGDDGKASAKNIGTWIGKGAPTDDVSFANLLNQAALEQTVAGVDTSKLGKDVFDNPGNYSGAEKAAAMVQLGNLSTQLAVGKAAGHWDPGMTTLALMGADINPNLDKVQADIGQRLTQLAQDPDVQAYLAQTKPTALQSIAGADGDVFNTMQSFYQGKFAEGGALNDDLAIKDKDGNQISKTAGLETFLQQAAVYDAAMGAGGKTVGLMTPGDDGSPSKLQQIVQASGQEGALQQEFTDQVLNGKMLTDAVHGGTDLTTAIGEYASAAAAYGTALDPGFMAEKAPQLRQNFTDTITDAVLGSGDKDDLAVAFGDKDGNFDEAKATEILQQLQKNDPSLFDAGNGQTLKPDQIVTLLRQSSDLVRNGVKVQDALGKVMEGVSAPSGAAADAYKAGALHIMSSVLAGGVLAAKAAEGAHTPLADASIAASAMQMVGTFTEGAAKWGGNVSTSLWGANNAAVPDDVKANIKNIENQGKLLGGLGGALSGALSIVSGVDALKNGDIAAGAVNIGTGAAGALAGVAGATEAGAGLLSTAGLLSSNIAEGVAAASSVLGIAGTVVGVLGAVGFGIYQIVEAAKANDKFAGQVIPQLQQYGITGGPFEPGDGDNGGPKLPDHVK